MAATARLTTTAVAWLALLQPSIGRAEPVNIDGDPLAIERLLATEPMKIVTAEISRPKAQGDITLKADVAFGDRAPFRVKLRKAMPGADTFNNTPRYDLAAYELQKLLMDPADWVVPPTALRMIPAADLRSYAAVEPTFAKSDDVLTVVQYWLKDILVIADVYDPAHFASDPVYAKHIGQLNIFTYLIGHRDSNAGNFLISKETQGARIYSVDNGVAFLAPEADRGQLWREIRVDRLPAATVERLRQITKETLTSRLGVVAQWQLRDGHYVPVTPGANLKAYRGVREKDGVVQMGLTTVEISSVWRHCRDLVEQLDDGKLKTF
jgi:hypothetical protein